MILHFENSKQNSIKLDRTKNIKNLLRRHCLNEENQELITNVCLEFKDILYLEGDSLTFTNEIKHSIDTNNAQPIYKEDVKI